MRAAPRPAKNVERATPGLLWKGPWKWSLLLGMGVDGYDARSCTEHPAVELHGHHGVPLLGSRHGC